MNAVRTAVVSVELCLHSEPGSVLCCCSVSVRAAHWEDGSTHWTPVCRCCLKRNLTPPESLVFADSQWLHFSPSSSDVQVDSSTWWHHCGLCQCLFPLQISEQFCFWSVHQVTPGKKNQSWESLVGDRVMQSHRCLHVNQHRSLQLYSHLLWLIYLPVVCSLPPSSPAFLFYLFVLMISVSGVRLICRKVKPTLNSQHASWSESVSWTVNTLPCLMPLPHVSIFPPHIFSWRWTQPPNSAALS